MDPDADWEGFKDAVLAAARVGGVCSTTQGFVEDVGVCYVIRRDDNDPGGKCTRVFVGGEPFDVHPKQWDELWEHTRAFLVRKATRDFSIALHATAVQFGKAMKPVTEAFAKMAQEISELFAGLSESEAAELRDEIAASPLTPREVASAYRARKRAERYTATPYHAVISPNGTLRMLTAARGQRRGR